VKKYIYIGPVSVYNSVMPIGTTVQKPREAHQSMLAKLLARENITVRFGNYQTAFFEPKTRVLGMPMWNAESKQVSDLLVGHEVGHALYTPQDGIEKFQKRFPDIPFDICNVIEDVRIERMIQSTYPGLVHSFREGYRSFLAKDLFKINGVDLAKLSVADRINLHAKVGHLVDVPLSAEERVIYESAYAAESFDDVLEICQRLYNLVEKSQQSQSEDDSPQPNKSGDKQEQIGQSGASRQKQPSERAEKTESEKSDADSKSDAADSDSSESDSNKSALKSNTKGDKSESEESKSGQAEESKSSQAEDTDDSGDGEDGDDNHVPSPDDKNSSDDQSSNAESQYSPKMSDNFSATHQREFDKGTAQMQECINTNQVNVPTSAQMLRAVAPLKKVLDSRRADLKYDEIMSNPQLTEAYGKFKDSTKKHVQVLIKEFERRKAAYQYSRARRSTNGTLDVNRLHSYKYEDQIFRSVTTLAEAKNHGMAFFIDYSGSMVRTLGSVIEQTIQLVTFCKAVNIPFVVYGFTSRCEDTGSREPVSYAPGMTMDFDNVNIFEILNSSLKKIEFDKCIKEMYAMSWYRRSYGNYSYHRSTTYVLFVSNYEVFGGTPLVETVVIASELVKRFRSAHNIQKMSTTFLTDGDPCFIRMHDNNIDRLFRKNTERWGNGYEMRFGNEIINWTHQYPKNAMAAAIRAFRTITQSTVIGYFIADNQKSFKSHCIDSIRNVDRKMISWTDGAEKFKACFREIRANDGVLTVKNGGGYDMFFAFDGRGGLTIKDDEDSDFTTKMDMDNLDTVAAHNKLAKEFTKFSSSKKSSRVFVHKFAEMIS
jgi:hypothetical protein